MDDDSEKLVLSEMLAASEVLIVRAAIAARMKEELPGIDVEEFPRARMGTEDFEAVLKNRALAVRVAFAGIVPDSKLNSNEVDAPCVWSVFVVAKDVANLAKRDKLALALVPTIMRAAARGGWTESGAENEVDEFRVEKLGARQLYAGEVDHKSACLWVVEWHQRIALKPPPLNDLRDFITLITKYDLAPPDEVFEATDVIPERLPVAPPVAP